MEVSERSKTLMFVNCSPASSNYEAAFLPHQTWTPGGEGMRGWTEETVMTLKFATRAGPRGSLVKASESAHSAPSSLLCP